MSDHTHAEPTAEELRELADQLGQWQAQEEAQAKLLGQTYTRKAHTMKLSEAFPSKWLKADDLGGKSHLVKIETVNQETVGKGADSETKLVVYFAGKKKGVILNLTNAKAIAAKYGDDTDEWRGAEVELYPQEVTFQGKTGPAIRIRVPVPQASADEEIPF